MKTIILFCGDCGHETTCEGHDTMEDRSETFCSSLKDCNSRRKDKGLPPLSPHKIFHADFLKGITHYCHRCDAAKVNSDKPETGKFYCASGSRRLNHNVPVEDKDLDGSYTQVFWAVCPNCEP